MVEIVRADRSDTRDLKFMPSYVELPEKIEKEYFSLGIPILDQGEEGACTGFALATAIHYNLIRRGNTDIRVSPHYLYANAKEYDEWPGEDYEGSSCRGALKGFHNMGACALKLYPKPRKRRPTDKQVRDAGKRRLAAYFRIEAKNLYHMHAALALGGVIFASANIHSGWDAPAYGYIKFKRKVTGGHAFVIVGYNYSGFWIQNSWGESYGRDGFCHLTYKDWLHHGFDAWLVNLSPTIQPKYRY